MNMRQIAYIKSYRPYATLSDFEHDNVTPVQVLVLHYSATSSVSCSKVLSLTSTSFFITILLTFLQIYG